MGEQIINGYAFILLLAVIQAVIFAIMLIIRAIREQYYSDYYLAALLLLLGLSLMPQLLGWLSIGILWNDFTFLPWNGFEMAIVPTAFLFLESRLNSNWRFQRKYLALYTLYIIYFCYHLVIGLQGKEFAKWWWFEINNHYNIDAVFSFCNAILFGYLLWRFQKVFTAFQTWIATQFSNLAPLDISWIKHFIVAYFIYIAADIALTIMELTIGAQYDKMTWFYIITLGLIYYISMYGFYQLPTRQLYFEQTIKLVNEEQVNTIQPYTPEEIDAWSQKISHYLQSEKPYLNPDLRLTDLANYFNINVSQLSTLMNVCFAKNFNELINEYRIETLKEKIAAGKLSQFTLLSLAFECGFNSKSTFNRAFKKYTGMNPSEFLNK